LETPSPERRHTNVEPIGNFVFCHQVKHHATSERGRQARRPASDLDFLRLGRGRFHRCRFAPSSTKAMGRTRRDANQQILALCNRLQQFVNSLQLFSASTGACNSLYTDCNRLQQRPRRKSLPDSQKPGSGT
jgi:hypothetical protein